MHFGWNRIFGITKNQVKSASKLILKKSALVLQNLPLIDLGLILIILGLLLTLVFPLYKKAYNIWNTPAIEPQADSSQAFQFAEPIKIDFPQVEANNPQQFPIKIVIPNISLDLPVTPSKIKSGFWEVSETTASYGLGSAIPGQQGNTVIFAHARQGLFGNLNKVKISDVIYVLTKDQWFLYTVKEIKEVTPNQVEVIRPTEDEVLTLYTCSGFADTKRLIVVGKRNN